MTVCPLSSHAGMPRGCRAIGAMLAVLITLTGAWSFASAASADTVVGTVTVGSAPNGVAVTPDGTHAYVANNNGGSVSVIDTATNAVVRAVSVGMGPYGVAVTPDGTRVYVTSAASGTVSMIDTAADTVVNTLPVGGNPLSVAITPDGTRAYLVRPGAGSVSVIDTATSVITKHIGLPGTAPVSVAISPDGTRAYVTGTNTYVIDTATNTVVGTVALQNTESVALAPDGAHVYITSPLSQTMSVVDTATNTVVNTIPLGFEGFNVGITPDGARAYVINPNGASISVIDLATNTVIETIAVGRSPRALAFTPAGTRAYVTNQDDGTVSVIAVEIAPTLTGTAPSGAVGTPYAAAFDLTGRPAPTVTVTDGALPPGITLDPNTAELSGTPSIAGVFTFTLTATNNAGNAHLPVTITIDDTPCTGSLCVSSASGS